MNLIKRILFGTGIFLLTLIPKYSSMEGTLNNNFNLNQLEANLKESAKKDILKIKEYSNKLEISVIDNIYLTENLRLKKDSIDYNDPTFLEEQIKSVKGKDKRLTNGQIKRIYLILNALKDSFFRKEIGKIIQEDIIDTTSENGGIIIFNDKNKIHLKGYKSLPAEKEEYLIPDDANLRPKLAFFHLHASSENESKYSNPSSRDTIISYNGADLFGEYHEFLITSIEKRKFNIKYYGADKKLSLKNKIIDLGDYEY